MNVDRIIEQNTSFRNALIDILRFKDSVPEYALQEIIELAKKVLHENQSCITVLKQINGVGPIYKLEVCQNSLEVIEQEVIERIPSEWSVEEFCTLLAKGNSLEITITKPR
ncbi:hypothetical protein [Bacillus massiliigorillae]|uniref:hypothetical protein n=1 Tax=Bacillus massiliigorillae TaxID=1243664 RepID=UPI00039ACD73|nr:hypothetical protein [Bacillus massiliigorillae]